MKVHLDEGLRLAPQIQNYLEENGLFTYRDLLYCTLKVTGEDAIDTALDMPVMLPSHMQLYLREQGIVTLRDLLGSGVVVKLNDSEDGEIFSAARAGETPKLGEVLLAIPLLQFGVGQLSIVSWRLGVAGWGRAGRVATILRPLVLQPHAAKASACPAWSLASASAIHFEAWPITFTSWASFLLK